MDDDALVLFVVMGVPLLFGLFMAYSAWKTAKQRRGGTDGDGGDGAWGHGSEGGDSDGGDGGGGDGD